MRFLILLVPFIVFSAADAGSLLPDRLRPAIKVNGDRIDEHVIVEVFANALNENGSNYSLSEIEWEKGAFTRIDALEALVSFYDVSQSHAVGWSETWLMSFEDAWKINRKLGEGDKVSFERVDIEDDGRWEVWLTMSSMFQGAAQTESQLISLRPDASSILYVSSGIDDTGAGMEGEAMRQHITEFRDIDQDGVLEILDLEKRKSYQWTGEKWESDYVVISAESTSTTYKLMDGEFRAIE
jgi:hypothetical protein